MTRKLDLIKSRSRSKAVFELDNTKEVEAIDKMSESIAELKEALTDQEEYDFGKIETLLGELKTSTEQLGESFQAIQIPEVPKEMNVKGLDELIKSMKAPAPISEPVVSGFAKSDNVTIKTIIEAPTRGKLVISDIVICNTSSIDSYLVIKDGNNDRLFYPAPMKGGAIHSLRNPLILSSKSALNFQSLSSVNQLIVSAIGTVRLN